MNTWKLLLLLAGVALSFLPETVQANEAYAPLKPFLNRYCVKCHDAQKQKGEVRLDDFEGIDGALWSEIYDQIRDVSMPPEDALQPSATERESIAKLVLAISRDEKFSIATGYRRLNRREFRNTVRDLLGLKPGIYDPAARIFNDDVDDGFDTNAAGLVISNELLLEYLESAEDSLRMALFLKDLKPPVTRVVEFNPGRLQSGDRRFTTNKKKSTVMRGSGQYVAQEDSRRVEVAGRYRITIEAAGVDRNNYGAMKFPPAKGPIKMGIGVQLDSVNGKKKATWKLEKTFDLQDEQFESYSAEVWLEKGAYPWVGFLNGAGKPASAIRQAVRQRKVSSREVSPERYRGPGVEVTRFSVEGPLEPEWPPATYRTIFQSDTMPAFENAQVRTSLIRRFLSRAYRHPATDQDVQDYVAYLNKQHQKTQDWQEAFIKTFAAVMASHDFLYIKENTGQLPPFELASRLSYFLWSTMPDAELFRLAASGRILDADVYAAQVDRMLRDAKTDEFVRGFTTQWLSLDLLGTMPPDIKDRRYSAYHRGNYEEAFRQETLHFFRYILLNNQPAGDFLDSKYAIINDTLAKVYNVPFKGGSKFRRVTLPEGSVRGGLIGQGSILSLTSNGVETLPVTRGHWVLDELLGTPPPAPPEEVPALVPDLNGANTPRDQLVRHRENPACFACHKQMDPLGLALENFDVIGRYRTKYESGARIDASGELSGARFKTVAELRQILRSGEDRFAKNLTVKLAEYAKGRKLNRRDLEIVDQIVVKAKTEQFRLQSLLRRILLSKLMRDR